MAHAIEPTDQLLREACVRMAQRFGWTEGFDALMRDPARSRLVRLAAKHPTAAGRSTPCAPRQQPANGATPRRQGLPPIDRKRAASGERDDD